MWGICGDYLLQKVTVGRTKSPESNQGAGTYLHTYLCCSSASYATMFRTSILQRRETTIVAGYNNSALRCLYLNSCTCIHRVPTETDMNFLTPVFFKSERHVSLAASARQRRNQPPIFGGKLCNEKLNSSRAQTQHTLTRQNRVRGAAYTTYIETTMSSIHNNSGGDLRPPSWT